MYTYDKKLRKEKEENSRYRKGKGVVSGYIDDP